MRVLGIGLLLSVAAGCSDPSSKPRTGAEGEGEGEELERGA